MTESAAQTSVRAMFGDGSKFSDKIGAGATLASLKDALEAGATVTPLKKALEPGAALPPAKQALGRDTRPPLSTIFQVQKRPA